MYAKLCNVEILQSYIKEVSLGDVLTIQALVTNPLDWQHFYEKVSIIHRHDKTDFTVVTREGDRIVGKGEIIEVEKWSNNGQYGFKLKLDVKSQKSLTDRRIRGPGKSTAKPALKTESHKPREVPVQVAAAASARTTVSMKEMELFRDMLKGSLTMDISR